MTKQPAVFPFVSTVTGVLRKLPEAPVVLGPKTLILGEPGTGKTSIIQAIAFALTAAAKDVRVPGSVSKDPATLLTLAPFSGSGERVEAHVSVKMPKTVTLASGELAEAWTDEAASTVLSAGHRPKPGGLTMAYEDVFALDAVQDLVFGGTDKLARLINQWIGLKEDVNAETRLKSIEEAGRSAKARLDVLTAARDRTATELAELPVLTIPADETKARAAEKAVWEFDAAQKRLEEFTARKAQLQEALNIQDAAPERELIEAALHAAVAHDGMDSCLVCGSEGVVFQAEALAEALEGMPEEGLTAEARARLERTLSDLREPGRPIGNRAALVEAASAARKAFTEAYKASSFRETLERSLADTERELVAVTNEHATCRTEYQTAKKAAAAWVETLQLLEETINAASPNAPNIKFLVDGRLTRVGYKIPGSERLNLTPSGSERARLLLRIARGIQTLQAGRGQTGLRILVSDDLAMWSPLSLTETLTVLSDAPFQVLITSTIAPKKVPKGWTVLNLDGGSVEAAAAEPSVEDEAAILALLEAPPGHDVSAVIKDALQVKRLTKKKAEAILLAAEVRGYVSEVVEPVVKVKRDGYEIIQLRPQDYRAYTPDGTAIGEPHTTLRDAIVTLVEYMNVHPADALDMVQDPTEVEVQGTRSEAVRAELTETWARIEAASTSEGAAKESHVKLLEVTMLAGVSAGVRLLAGSAVAEFRAT